MSSESCVHVRGLQALCAVRSRGTASVTGFPSSVALEIGGGIRIFFSVCAKASALQGNFQAAAIG